MYSLIITSHAHNKCRCLIQTFCIADAVMVMDEGNYLYSADLEGNRSTLGKATIEALLNTLLDQRNIQELYGNTRELFIYAKII